MYPSVRRLEWPTDGAASRAGVPGLARAAWAAHFGCCGPGLSGPVPWAQTAQRAELYAAIQALARRTEPLTIVTDSMFVHRGFQAMAISVAAPFGAHQDLWSVAAALGGGQSVVAR